MKSNLGVEAKASRIEDEPAISLIEHFPSLSLKEGSLTLTEVGPLKKLQTNLVTKKSSLYIALYLITLFVSTLLWWISLPFIDVDKINDLGLVSVLPPTWFLAVGILSTSFVSCLYLRRTSSILLFLHLVLLIFIIHGTLPLVYAGPRYSWTYKHIGVTAYIQSYKKVDPLIDVYQNWPGFFALSAFFNEVAGIDSAFNYAAWAQLFFNLLYLGALLFVFKALTNDPRHVWFGAWLFFLTNWVGQDYYSPQAMAYFFHLIILGICLTWFKASSALPKLIQNILNRCNPLIYKFTGGTQPAEIKVELLRSWQLALLKVVLLISFAYIVSSHQLSPFMTLACVASFVIFRRSRGFGLILVMFVILISWITYPAITYMGKDNTWFSSLGRVSDNISSGVSSVSYLSSQRSFVVFVTRGLTFLIWGLALLGGFRRLKKGNWDLPPVLIILSSFAMVGAQSYGGEILFRVFFFALPGVAFLAAGLLYPDFSSAKSIKSTIACLLITITLLVAFLFAYYGQEKMDHFTANEIAASKYLYNEIAPPSESLFVMLTYNFPTNYTANYFWYNEFILTSQKGYEYHALSEKDFELMKDNMFKEQYPAAYLIINQAQMKHSELLSVWKPGSFEAIENMAYKSNRFKLIYSNSDVQIFQFIKNNEGVKN